MSHQHTSVSVKVHKENRLAKFIAILFWGLFLLLNTWTKNLEPMFHLHSVEFKWNLTPNFLSFFYFYDIDLIHRHFIIIKLGHFIGFAIMDLLIYNLIRSHKASIGISAAFAFFTEFFQLYWGCDGRLFDLESTS